MPAPRKTTQPPRKKAPAEEQHGGTTRKTASATDGAPRQTAAAKDGRLPLKQVVLRAAGELGELIGQPPEGVVAVDREHDDWKIQVEVVESHRIPETTDILAIYELVADGKGQLISYRRLNRYVRGRFEE
ncbi:hypothetical protein GCM10009804_24130 [Kribbella hippodromi]|uniref:Gas vesicle protein n=1 Tax=Kribbella hippodromi TaxID=434347 RepID=A0ABN2D0E8_9ACTN